ncbi:sigma-70 family RNA polymerase sigma factor [Phytomonospora sp. NPDC050363]|uniref:RNA polymerase sigma factor n=1 Tax=Phytomonospora sp. NPDC050363 TaxID=3155642 RepID=UPI0034023303
MTHPAEQAYRAHYGRLLALLAGEHRSLDVAEEALADAYAKAVATWRPGHAPDNPAAWLLTVARRAATDRWRRQATAMRKLPLLITDDDTTAPSGTGPVPDERLRLIFTCCHPALAPAARVALTLRYITGLRTREIARLFLVTEATMAARLTRAKKKIATAGVPYRVPAAADLHERLDTVLHVVYLVFTEGYKATEGAALTRDELADEAIRLAAVVAELMPGERDVSALRALMLLQHARRDARTDTDGDLVRLSEQDRSAWHRHDIDEGLRLLAHARRGTGESRFLIEAQIAAAHATAATPDDTDWDRISALYARLEQRTGSPVVRLNRAVAVAEAQGPAAGLALLEGLDTALAGHHMLPAARAELHTRLGQRAQAHAAYTAAIALAGTDTERRWLASRREAVS